MTMDARERDARLYCAEIGADPDEEVRGYVGGRHWVVGPRWTWYLMDYGQRRYRPEAV